MSHTTETGDPETFPRTATTSVLGSGVAAIAVAGSIDLGTVVLLKQAVTRALGHQPQRLIIDLTGVRFLSAAGVSALIQARAIADAQSCVLYLQGARPHVVMMLSASGADGLFPLL